MGLMALAVLVIVGLAAMAIARDLVPSPAAAAVPPGPEGRGLSVVVAQTPIADLAPGAPATAMLPAGQPTLVLGDSLGLVVYPWLADLLPDRYVSYAALVGRSTPSTANALSRLGDIPPVVLVSSGTNDGSAASVEQSARDILDALGAARCVVWVDVVRPERIGDPQADINAAIGRAIDGRSNVSVLRWSEMVAAHPEWIGTDGIHPTSAGAQARATAFAAASQACSPTDPGAPRAERTYLPASAFSGPIHDVGAGATSTPGASATPSGTASIPASPSGSALPTNSASATPSPSPTSVPSTSASASPTPTVSATPTLTAQ